MNYKQDEILNIIAQKIYDKKGFNILGLDVRGVSTLTDFFLIAEGSVERHVQALAREVLETMEQQGLPLFHIDGDQTGDWIVIDAGSILVHLFISELREKYRLEELWHEAKIVDLKLKIEGEKK